MVSEVLVQGNQPEAAGDGESRQVGLHPDLGGRRLPLGQLTPYWVEALRIPLKLQQALAAEFERLRSGRCWNDRQLHPVPLARCACGSRGGQATAEHFLRDLAQLPTLADRAELHLADQVFRKIDGGFHGASSPAFQLAVKFGFGDG